MHYGRLQIFKPDEPVENFFIEKESIAIGRSPGNDLIFERNGVSRYHVSLIVQNQHLVLQDLDSVNGTYVDGIRVRANEQYLLRGGEEIQIGDVRLVFHPVTDAFQPIRADVQVVELDNFRVELEGPNIPITPGAHAPATISIENTGFNTEHFVIEVDGVPKEWVRLDRGDFDLLPGAQVQVGINFKPLRRPESTPGEYTITVRAYSQVTPEDVAVLKTTIHILQYNGYGMVMGTPLIVDNQPFQIYIHNQGNGPLSLNFRGFHKSKSLKFDIRTPVITLQAGQRETIVGNIRPLRRTWFGKPRTYSYDIISHSQDAAGFQAPISGEYMISPVFAQWVLFAGIAAILVGLVALFYTIGTALQPEPTTPRPRISFALSAAEAEFGDPVTFDWQAVRATSVRYTVKRGDELILSADLPDTEGDDQPIMNLPGAGEYTVTVIATNDDDEHVESQKTLQINPNIAEFTVTTDNTFYRNVVGQSASVAWDVQGVNDDSSAQDENSISLTSNIDYTYEGDYSSTLSSAEITFLPTTTEVIELTLQAHGLDDTTASETQTIQVVYPICSVASITQIYEGPTTYFPDYIFLGFLGADTSFEVDSRYYPTENIEGDVPTWVRIEIPSDLGFPDPDGWIDATQITCDPDFDYTRLVNLTTDQLPVTPRYFNPLELGVLRLNQIREESIQERNPVSGPNFLTAAVINGISSSSAREETHETDTTITSGRSAVILVSPETIFRVDLAENDAPSNMRTLLLPFGTTIETSSISRTDIFARPAVQTEEFEPTGVFIFTGRYGNPEGGSEIRLDESPNIRFKSRGQCMAGEYLTPEIVAFTCYGGEDTECEVQTEQTLAVPGRYTIVDIPTGAILASSESIPYNIALRHYEALLQLFDEDQALALATTCFQSIDRDIDGVIDAEDECPDVAFGGGADCIVYPEGDGDDDADDNS